MAASLLAMLAAITWQRASLWADQGADGAVVGRAKPGIVARASHRRQLRSGRHIARTAPWRVWQALGANIPTTCNWRSTMSTPPARCAGCVRPKSSRSRDRCARPPPAVSCSIAGWAPRWTQPGPGSAQAWTWQTVARWITAARANPHMAAIPGRQQDLHSLAGRLALARGDAAAALLEFNRALDASPTPQAAAKQAALLASNGAYALGLAHLDHYAAIEQQRDVRAGWNMRRIHAWVLRRQGFWQNELSTLRRKMQADLAAKNHDGS